MEFAKILFIGLASLAGCNLEKPDGYRLGLVYREASGRYRISDEKKMVPLGRLEAYYNLDKRLEWNLRFDYIDEDFDFVDNEIYHKVVGNMQSIGSGIKYYPFCEHFSFDIGAEIFRGEVDAIAKFSTIRDNVSDEVYGWGANLGCSTEFEMRKNISLSFSAGYNFTDNESDRIKFDFDGFYTFVGIKISVK